MRPLNHRGYLKAVKLTLSVLIALLLVNSCSVVNYDGDCDVTDHVVHQYTSHDLKAKLHQVKFTTLSDVQSVCVGYGYIGCTSTDYVSKVWKGLVGRKRVEAIAHELKHQYDYRNRIPIDEPATIIYGYKIRDQLCKN